MPDLFLSYRTARADEAAPLVAALEARGITVWQDTRRVEQGSSITRAVREGLAECRALLAFWSIDYAESRVCLWELSLAFTCAEADRRPGARPTDRVGVVVPPGGDADSVVGPVRDGLYFAVEGAQAGWANSAAKAIQAWLSRLDHALLGALGRQPLRPANIEPTQAIALGGVHWAPHKRLGSNRFVGRLQELWDLHGHLRAGENVVVTGVGTAAARVQGLAGVGKSLLALEYAHRFEAAWPGGIFVIDAAEEDPDQVFAMLAEHVGVDPRTSQEHRASATRRALTAWSEPYLWLVDNLPAQLEQQEAEAWLAPGKGATLFTTRGTKLRALGACLDLRVLSPEDALRLLTNELEPTNSDEADAAAELCKQVGFLPLAIDVLRALVRIWNEEGEFAPYAAWIAELERTDRDALADVEAELADEGLPIGGRARLNVTIVIQRALAEVSAEGWDVLRVCALLAEAPVPIALVVGVLTTADGVPEEVARRLVRRGRTALRGRSLVQVADGTLRVHALVRRVVQRVSGSCERSLILKEAVPEAVGVQLEQAMNDPYRVPANHAEDLLEHAIPTLRGPPTESRMKLAKQVQTLLIDDLAAPDTRAVLKKVMGKLDEDSRI